MFERTSTNTVSQIIGYALFATSLFWLCEVCTTDGPAKVYPGLEPGMNPDSPSYISRHQSTHQHD